MSNYSQPKASLTTLLLTYAVNNLKFVLLPYSVFCDDVVCVVLYLLQRLRHSSVQFSFVQKTAFHHDANRHVCGVMVSYRVHIQVLRQNLQAMVIYRQHAQVVSQSAQNALFPSRR